jgi:uncharacterized membrane protein YidH (DUF202 family)
MNDKAIREIHRAACHEDSSIAIPRSTEPPDLSAERTYLAHERTLMAWTRTAASLISFGLRFTNSSKEWGCAASAIHSAMLRSRCS